MEGSPPVQYFQRLPRKCESDVAYILDPVVATAATIMSVVAILKKVRNSFTILFYSFSFLCLKEVFNVF